MISLIIIIIIVIVIVIVISLSLSSEAVELTNRAHCSAAGLFSRTKCSRGALQYKIAPKFQFSEISSIFFSLSSFERWPPTALDGSGLSSYAAIHVGTFSTSCCYPYVAMMIHASREQMPYDPSSPYEGKKKQKTLFLITITARHKGKALICYLQKIETVYSGLRQSRDSEIKMRWQTLLKSAGCNLQRRENQS